MGLVIVSLSIKSTEAALFSFDRLTEFSGSIPSLVIEAPLSDFVACGRTYLQHCRASRAVLPAVKPRVRYIGRTSSARLLCHGRRCNRQLPSVKPMVDRQGTETAHFGSIRATYLSLIGLFCMMASRACGSHSQNERKATAGTLRENA